VGGLPGIEILLALSHPYLAEEGRVVDPSELPTGLILDVHLFRERRLTWSWLDETPMVGEWTTLAEPARTVLYFTGPREPTCSAFRGKDRRVTLSSADNDDCDTSPARGLCLLEHRNVAGPITPAVDRYVQ